MHYPKDTTLDNTISINLLVSTIPRIKLQVVTKLTTNIIMKV